ncbi:von Willebrand factor type A [Methylobacterium sp. 4-46]|uniref:VWA domain-containing protein n=2 Tax=unclassified Methylobacterium TaxID=2615210 RepID=UPI000165CA90|nr:VWA domain-containing protein [Methylobacterium sp. 4-46]ACA15163.1 von Willebrand factor type A [Methylobacterium sp. 4-46]
MTAAAPAGERRRAALLRALWGRGHPILSLPAPAPDAPPQRPTFDEAALRLPHGAAPAAAREDRLAEASLAHLGAHLAFGGGRFPIGRLRPTQIALVSLIEDARVEALALRERPGLVRLWRPFHAGAAEEAGTAAGLMARLARALLDPDHPDPDAFVARGRALFYADPRAWADPGLSRSLGDRLGNDLGQMRLPFGPRAGWSEPAYRDDHAGMWERREIEAAARPERVPGPGDGADAPAADALPPRPGGRVWRYPEWDRRIRRARPGWVSLREESAAPALGRPTPSEPRLAAALAAMRPRRPRRMRRRIDGDELDLAAATDALADLRAGRAPDPRVYSRVLRRAEGVPLLLLVDASRSMGDPLPRGGRVIDAARGAAAALLGALAASGGPVAIQAFRSAGRHDVRVAWIKRWDEPPAAAWPRLAGLAPAGSTRLGAALRHAGRSLPPGRGAVILLTDGEPSDIDVHDPAFLAEDARMACRALAARGVGAFALALAPAPPPALVRAFTPGRCVAVAGPERLAGALVGLAARTRA